jgi:transcriptional regulator with XRE-family HTH domain
MRIAELKIGELLKAVRSYRHFSLAEMSRHTGITIATLSRVEQGKPPSARTICQFFAWMFTTERKRKSK